MKEIRQKGGKGWKNKFLKSWKKKKINLVSSSRETRVMNLNLSSCRGDFDLSARAESGAREPNQFFPLYSPCRVSRGIKINTHDISPS